VALCLFALSLLTQSPDMLLSQAGRELKAPQYSGAESELLGKLKSDPMNGSLWLSLGVARAQLKETDSAIEAFERALSLLPQKAAVYFDLGRLYMEKKDLAKAAEAYGRGLALDPSDIPANQNDAFVLTQRGEFREALAPLERLRKLMPDNVSTRASLIDAYLKAGLKDEGENEIDSLMGSHVLTLPEGLALAKLFAARQEADAARRVLEAMQSTWPNSAEAHGELGLLLIEKEQFKQAAQELRQAAQLEPDSEKYSEGFGEALLNSKQYAVALTFLQNAVKKFPNRLNFQYQLAFADVGLQRFPEAVFVLETLASKRPDSGKVQFLLGGAYELEGDLKKGEDHYRSAIQLAPEEPNSYRALGSLLQKQGSEHFAESTELLSRALALDPTDVETKVVLARCLEDQGELDKAAVLLEQAVASEPALLRAHTALAQLYHRQKKPALAEHEQAIAAKLEGEKISKEWDTSVPKSTYGP
jgi:tetratricopeptide (TPR) repeat protein